MDLERTYIMIKPDGVQRGLIGDIVKRFEQKGFKLVAAKLYSPSRAHFEKHYEDLKGKKFFPSMIDYMITGPVFCMVWAGKGAVKTGRKMLGETNPADSLPGSIRGDFCIDIGRNVCHGSDSGGDLIARVSLSAAQACRREWLAWDAADDDICAGIGSEVGVADAHALHVCEAIASQRVDARRHVLENRVV